MSSQPHQDWKPVVIHKKPPTAAELRSSKALNSALRAGNVESEKRSNTEQRGNKQTYDSTPHGAAAAKIADETENFHHDRVPTEIRTRIIEARNDKKMTQAQLAMAACLQPRVIQEYERGKAIPDGATLSKLARALGVPTLKKNRIVPDSI